MDFLVAEPNVPRDLAVPVVFFSHNVEYTILKRLRDVERRWWRRALLDLEWRKTRRCELAAVRRAEWTVAVSEADREVFAAAVPGAHTDVVPTGVDTVYFAPGPTPAVPRRLVFSGSMDWYPNEDAILVFRPRDMATTCSGARPMCR